MLIVTKNRLILVNGKLPLLQFQVNGCFAKMQGDTIGRLGYLFIDSIQGVAPLLVCLSLNANSQ
jgi:Na+/serine symporter